MSEQLLSRIENMNIAQELEFNMCNDGGAMVERTAENCWVLYEIPLYGGEPQAEGHYESHQLEDMIETALSWT